MSNRFVFVQADLLLWAWDIDGDFITDNAWEDKRLAFWDASSALSRHATVELTASYLDPSRGGTRTSLTTGNTAHKSHAEEVLLASRHTSRDSLLRFRK